MLLPIRLDLRIKIHANKDIDNTREPSHSDVHKIVVLLRWTPGSRSHQGTQKRHRNQVVTPLETGNRRRSSFIRSVVLVCLLQDKRDLRLRPVLPLQPGTGNRTREHGMDLHIIAIKQHLLRQSIAQALDSSFGWRVWSVSGNSI